MGAGGTVQSYALTPNTVELILTLEALPPRGGPVQDPVLAAGGGRIPREEDLAEILVGDLLRVVRHRNHLPSSERKRPRLITTRPPAAERGGNNLKELRTLVEGLYLGVLPEQTASYDGSSTCVVLSSLRTTTL